MSSNEERPKRMGRPRKAPEKGKRQNYTFRMSDADRDRVVAAAEASGRSISEEIEARVAGSFFRNPKDEHIEWQYKQLVDFLGGTKNVWPAFCFICTHNDAIKSLGEDGDKENKWFSDSNKVHKFREYVMEHIAESLDAITLNGGLLIGTHAKLFELNPKIMEKDYDT